MKFSADDDDEHNQITNVLTAFRARSEIASRWNGFYCWKWIIADVYIAR